MIGGNCMKMRYTFVNVEQSIIRILTRIFIEHQKKKLHFAKLVVSHQQYCMKCLSQIPYSVFYTCGPNSTINSTLQKDVSFVDVSCVSTLQIRVCE